MSMRETIAVALFVISLIHMCVQASAAEVHIGGVTINGKHYGGYHSQGDVSLSGVNMQTTYHNGRWTCQGHPCQKQFVPQQRMILGSGITIVTPTPVVKPQQDQDVMLEEFERRLRNRQP